MFFFRVFGILSFCWKWKNRRKKFFFCLYILYFNTPSIHTLENGRWPCRCWWRLRRLVEAAAIDETRWRLNKYFIFFSRFLWHIRDGRRRTASERLKSAHQKWVSSRRKNKAHTICCAWCFFSLLHLLYIFAALLPSTHPSTIIRVLLSMRNFSCISPQTHTHIQLGHQRCQYWRFPQKLGIYPQLGIGGFNFGVSN